MMAQRRRPVHALRILHHHLRPAVAATSTVPVVAQAASASGNAASRSGGLTPPPACAGDGLGQLVDRGRVQARCCRS